MYMFPLNEEKEEEGRWKKILHVNLNAKCRNARAAVKQRSRSSIQQVEDNDVDEPL